MPPLDYKEWPGRTWKVEPRVPPVNDLANPDQLTFELVENRVNVLIPTIRIKQVSCSHSTTTPHRGNDWTGICVGNKDKAVGITPSGNTFEIVSSEDSHGHTLTCTLVPTICLEGATGGSACWTATDG
jgi:hypothetical protein